MNQKDDTKKKMKRPTAAKRMIQNKKRRLLNKTKKSRIRTSIRRLDEALPVGNQKETEEALSLVFSLVDKGVKAGVVKKNKANRTKSRLAAKVAAKTATKA